MHEIRLMRLHVSETAAISAVLNDYGALAVAFPTVIDFTCAFEVLRERYAADGLVACLIRIRLTPMDEATKKRVREWIARLDKSRELEHIVNVYIR